MDPNTAPDDGRRRYVLGGRRGPIRCIMKQSSVSAAKAVRPHVEGTMTEPARKTDEVPEPAERAAPPNGGGDRAGGRARLEVRLDAYLRGGRARVVLTDNLRTMVSIRRGQGVITFRVHHMFCEAPARVVRALARYAERSDREASRILQAYVEANDCRIRAPDAARRSVPCDTAGRYHDLQEIFDDLNRRYFAGRIRATITWGRRMKRRRKRRSIKLGSYDFEQRLIRIHPILDAADVPRFYVAWVVYHEMLHEVCDIPIKDGRRVYHTPEFRRAEAAFEDYARAVMWERANVSKLLER